MELRQLSASPTPEPVWVPGYGPIPSSVVLVGEAPGLNETIYKRPFVGEAGDELGRMLFDAGLQKKDMYATNVFKIRPPDNKIGEFFVSRTDPDACLDLIPIGTGSSKKYLHCDFRPMVDGLIPELVNVGARVVISLGGTALWALLGYSKISAYVGTVHSPAPGRPFYIIPTYHPSAVLRNWSYRTTVIANLGKVYDCLATSLSRPAPRFSSSGGKPEFNIKINPTLSEVKAFAERAFKAPQMAVDVETAKGQIRTIAFSLGPTEAFVVPFWEPPAPSYWPTIEGELEAWRAVRRALGGPGTKIFHNGAYDIQYLWRVHGIPISGAIEDTMLAHHAMEPELPKSLGALSAVYLALPEWKTMRLKSEKEEE